MTFREKLIEDQPKSIVPKDNIGIGCPRDYGYEDKQYCERSDIKHDCTKCWNREMPNTDKETEESLNIIEAHNKAYNQGLNDAWKLAQRINIYSDDGGLRMDELEKIFDQTDTCKIMCLSYEEALAKLKAYEEQRNIEVGDVVFNKGTNEHCVITHIEGSAVVYCLYDDGSCGTSNIKECEKTDKHIDIKSILEQIGE